MTTRFVPGYGELRQQMIPEIANILKLKQLPAAKMREQAWTVLLSYAVLYAYSAGQANGDLYWNNELSPWLLKSTVEMFALRLALHRSGETLRSLLEWNSEAGADSMELHRYVIWLWLYTMSHHTSLLMRVPPTIVGDCNIRSASKLLERFSSDSRVHRVLAEVELSLLWNESAKHDPASAEWWCSPPTIPDVRETLTTLERLEGALDAWKKRYLQHDPEEMSVPPRTESEIFHYRFTRFCINTYATRSLYQGRQAAGRDLSDPAMNVLSMPVVKAVLRTTETAVDICTVFPRLSPMQRDRARYM